MAVTLHKGQKVSLTKENPNISSITVGLGWNPNKYSGGFDFDLDASVFMCASTGKCRDDRDFIFYGNLDSLDGSVHHTGDDRTGSSSDDSDDEQIIVDLSKVDPNINKIAITATIYDADSRGQNFGQVSNAYIRLVDNTTGNVILKYDLGEDFSVETAIVVAEIYRYENEWKFNAVGSGFSGGLAALCGNYGIEVA